MFEAAMTELPVPALLTRVPVLVKVPPALE
jgi:hypothetical protein